MGGTLEGLFEEASKRGLLVSGREYGKAALLDIFAAAGATRAEAVYAFNQIRAAAKSGSELGRLRVWATGERRGRRYGFEGLTPARTSASTAAVESRTPPPEPVARPSAREVHPVVLEASYSENAELDIHLGDNLPILQAMPAGAFDLIYIDPPFNTGKTQARTRMRTVRDDENGDRTGFQGQRYRTIRLGTVGFADAFDGFLEFLEPRLVEAKRLLKPDGSFFLHIDYREVHYCKVILDHIFGRDCFMNEIVWAYDYGGRSKKNWSAKHDNILWYVKSPEDYTFNFDEMDRIPYMAPGLVGKEKAARGKTPTDVWWHTIVPTNGKERTGYPTQKPAGILRRILKVHSRPGDRVLDFFAGSGTTGEAALNLGRSCTLIDIKPEAMEVMAKRLAPMAPRFHGWDAEPGSPSPSDAAIDGLASGPKVPAQRSLFD